MAVLSRAPVITPSVDRIRIHEIGVSAIMASRGEIVPEPVTPAVEDKIHVAVGNNVKESKLTLIWAVQNSGGKKICVLYVLVPSQKIRMEGLGAEIPVSSATEQMVRAHRETERRNMHILLDEYLRICSQMGVRAEKLFTEAGSIEKGILELIQVHGIRKLVMGAAADRRYSKKMMELKSKKAISVREEAPLCCHIWFICSGHLIHTRVSTLSSSSSGTPRRNDTQKLTNPVQDMFSRVLFSSNSERRGGRSVVSFSPESPPGPSTAQSTLEREESYHETERSSRRSRSQSSVASSCSSIGATEMISSPDVMPEMSDRRGEISQSNCNDEDSAPSSTLDVNMNDDLYDQLEQALTEVENAKIDTLQEAVRRAKAEKDAIEGMRKVKALESLYAGEHKLRKEIEEALAKEEEELGKMKNQRDEVLEELRIALDQKSSLESQIAETDQIVNELEQKIISAVELLQSYHQERNELQIERDNALRKAEELRSRQGDTLSATFPQYFSEFSFSEIEEATRNFHPSLKIGEGGYGSIYKGSLRHTPVAIKMLHSHSLQGPQEFQQEVDVLSKVRHPNLVTLIGACPEAWTLVYEYLPNGSLEDRLSCRDNTPPLSWQTRTRIATELCSALIFLHSSKPHNIVHGDLKPANILLDAHLESKLSDFGICRLLSLNERSSNNTALCRTDPKGTFVYMDPEFLSTGELTTKSDVYSFGIILLRLLTGRPALGISKEVQYALSAGKLKSLLDPLAGDWPYVLAEQLAHLALRCCEMNRKDRPDLGSDVWRVLEPMRASCGDFSSFRMNSEERWQPPPYFICPILQEVMQDPQVAADGFTYEAEALRGWLESGHDASPMTNLQLAHKNLVPNRALRSAIQEWLQNH
ncbi:U-box domain-containing protein 33-like isoform X2 [Rhodamnia argentea]|uniref:RING-type E3 ubiquitin transferase n=1 Tax=Rhodamnia argentea TaxID=178133 RepID=A0A8B8MUB3_9MYRT|nr:U-box domain-containing protein 33-like isoform X2 [Rhodamnia argentea]